MLQMQISDLVAGQPKAEYGKKNNTARDFYSLGRASAFLEQQKKELDQSMQMNQLQLNMLAQSKQGLLDVLGDVKREQKGLNDMLASVQPPPPDVAGFPGGVPPTGLGELPAEAGNAMPMQGMPSQAPPVFA